MLQRTILRSARAAATRPAPFTAFVRPAQHFQNAARPIVASRFYATEGEKAEEKKTETTETETEADKIKKELEAKNKEISDFKVSCSRG